LKQGPARNKAEARLAGSEGLAMQSAVQLQATGNILLPAVCCRPRETTEHCAVRHAFVALKTNELTQCAPVEEELTSTLDVCGVIGCVYHCVTVLECRGVRMVRDRRKDVGRLVIQKGISAVAVISISARVFVMGNELTVRLELSFCTVYQFGRSQSIKIDNSFFQRVEQFKYLGTTIAYRSSIQEEIKGGLKSGNACYHSVQNLCLPVCYPKI
jgi:hypothetical protein